MRPYIGGFDDSEFYNLMKSWFKHGGLVDYARKSIENEGDTVAEQDISKIVYHLEDKIREELYEFAKELEESKTKLESFLDGVDFALWHEDKSE